jgi:HemK-like putative methylase
MPARDAVRRIIDVGTGSGCLAVALAIEFPSATVLAADSSKAALEVAGRNLLRHNLTTRVSLVHTNLLDGITESAELIVSNPPYVPETDAPRMQPEVIRYEPRTALFAGADGLDVIRRLFTAASAHLAERGRLIVEFGLGQEDELRGASRETGWTVDHVRRDLQGIPRVVVLRR